MVGVEVDLPDGFTVYQRVLPNLLRASRKVLELRMEAARSERVVLKNSGDRFFASPSLSFCKFIDFCHLVVVINSGEVNIPPTSRWLNNSHENLVEGTLRSGL